MRGRIDAAAHRRHAATACPEADIHTRGDVVHIFDRLSHLAERLRQLFVGSVELRLHGIQRAAQPDEDRFQSERHDQVGDPARYPHDALTAHRQTTLRATYAPTT